MVTKEQFIENCKKGLCLRKTIKSDKCNADFKRERCYDKYLKVNCKEKDLVDEKWEEAKKIVLKRDGEHCRMLRVLTLEEFAEIKDSLPNWNRMIDICHIISRAQSPQDRLYYNPDNLVCMYRCFHARIDQYKNPVTGASMTKEDRDNWFVRVVGQDMWNKLKNISKE